MSGVEHVVTVLRAQVKVLRTDKDGNQILEQTGDFTTAGTPVLRPSTRPLTVFGPRRDKHGKISDGQTLPGNLAPGELERLQALGVVREKGVIAATETPAPKKPTKNRKPAPAKETPPADPAAPSGLDLDNLAEATDDDLLAGVGQVGETALIAAVGADADLARRVLEAENLATKQDPRAGLVDELDKVIAATETPAA